MRNTAKLIAIMLFIVFIINIINLSINADVAVTQEDIKDRIQSYAAVLMDGDTGQVLFEKNMNEKMYPASITKIMTALIALEKGNPKDTITMSYDAVYSIGRDTSHVALDENENLTLENALYALAICSANDASNGIAEYIGGSMKDFAMQMTEKAKSLGALKTNFTNAHGLHNENHYTTAYDMAKIMAEALKKPGFSKIFSAASYDMPPTNRQVEARQFNRKNSLLNGDYKYDGVIAEKTGWTPDSGFTFVSAARRGERTLIVVVMKSPDEISRWEDTTALFDYGFDEFVPLSFGAEEFIKRGYVIEATNGTAIDTDLIPTGDFTCLVLKSVAKQNIEVKYMLTTENKNIGADTNNAGGKLHGRAVFLLNPSVSQQSMFYELGEIDMRININADEKTVSDFVSGSTQSTETTKKQGSLIAKIFEIIGFIVVVILFIFVVLYIRKNIIVQRRKKRRFSGYGYKDRYYY